MFDDTASTIGVLIGLTIVLFGGAAVAMFWTAWLSTTFGILAPIGYWEAFIGYVLTSLLVSFTFGGPGGN